MIKYTAAEKAAACCWHVCLLPALMHQVWAHEKAGSDRDTDTGTGNPDTGTATGATPRTRRDRTQAQATRTQTQARARAQVHPHAPYPAASLKVPVIFVSSVDLPTEGNPTSPTRASPTAARGQARADRQGWWDEQWACRSSSKGGGGSGSSPAGTEPPGCPLTRTQPHTATSVHVQAAAPRTFLHIKACTGGAAAAAAGLQKLSPQLGQLGLHARKG